MPANNFTMFKPKLLYVVASFFSSLSIGFGIGFYLASSALSFVILPSGKQYQILMLLALLFGAFIYILVFRQTENRSDFFTKLHIPIYWLLVLFLCISFFINFSRQSATWTLWEHKPLENIQLNQGYAYQAATGHPEFSYQQLRGGALARVLENGIPLPGETADCSSTDIYTMGRGNVCFWGTDVLFSTSDNSDPRANARLYEILFPVFYIHTFIYILMFLSVVFAGTNIFFLASNKNRKNFLLILFVTGLPFIYLFPYVIPLNHSYIGIGNDYQYLYYDYKVYLLDFLSRLKIPFWSPSEAAGFPFYSNPFAQTFYPFNILLAIYYRIAGGYTVFDHQRFTVFGISLFALGLFLWLRQLNLNLRAVLFGALVMAVSFKVTEIMRFPNAIHTAAWYPWTLYAITGIFQAKSRRQAWRYGMLLFFSLVCLLTGGYPYYVFYSIFLFIPYLLLFFIPEIRKTVFDIQSMELKRTFRVLLTTSLAALAVCAPYLSKMASLLRQTTDRGGNSYEYSTAYVFNFTDTIGSLVFPPAAQLEGIYYFGAVGVLLILFYVFSGAKGGYSSLIPLGLKDEGETRTSRRIDIWFKLFLLAWIVCISYITYGRESYLFNFLWHNMPLFSSLRVWGRMNIILVPILAWFLALAYQYFESTLFCRVSSSHDNEDFKRLRSVAYLVLSFSIVFAIQLVYLGNKVFDYYWTGYKAPENIPAIWSQYFTGQEWLRIFFKTVADRYATLSSEEIVTYIGLLFMMFTLSAFIILVLFVLHSYKKPDSRQSRWFVWIILFIFSIVNMGGVGPWLWTYGVLNLETRLQLNIGKKDMESFTVERIKSAGIDCSNAFNVSIMPNWYFNRYVSFLKTQEEDSPALDQLLGITDGKKLYFSEHIDYLWAREFLQDAGRFQDFENVVSYTGDKLVVNVRAPKAGFLSFIDNWDEDWTATVDGMPISINLLFGTFKSVQLTPGDHQVIFEYRPSFFR